VKLGCSASKRKDATTAKDALRPVAVVAPGTPGDGVDVIPGTPVDAPTGLCKPSRATIEAKPLLLDNMPVLRGYCGGPWWWLSSKMQEL